MANVFNPGDTPVVIDEEGRVLGGREHLNDADPKKPLISAALEAGSLVRTDERADVRAAARTAKQIEKQTESETSEREGV